MLFRLKKFFIMHRVKVETYLQWKLQLGWSEWELRKENHRETWVKCEPRDSGPGVNWAHGHGTTTVLQLSRESGHILHKKGKRGDVVHLHHTTKTKREKEITSSILSYIIRIKNVSCQLSLFFPENLLDNSLQMTSKFQSLPQVNLN